MGLGKNRSDYVISHVHDPTDTDDYQIPIGKQTLGRGGMIWYTPCSGIWQTVFLESTPAEYITKVDLHADMNGQVNVTVHSSTDSSSAYEIRVHEQNSEDIKAKATGISGIPFIFQVDSPKVWSPNEPNLYNITIVFGTDMIQSYTGFRTVSRGVINGVQRPLLNGKFIFPFGPLDQGYWQGFIHLSVPTLG